MAIIETIGELEFCSRLSGDFSCLAAKAIFNYFSEFDRDIEFDPIVFKIEFCEENMEDYLKKNNLPSFEHLQRTTFAVDLGNGNVLFMAY